MLDKGLHDTVGAKRPRRAGYGRPYRANSRFSWGAAPQDTVRVAVRQRLVAKSFHYRPRDDRRTAGSRRTVWVARLATGAETGRESRDPGLAQSQEAARETVRGLWAQRPW